MGNKSSEQHLQGAKAKLNTLMNIFMPYSLSAGVTPIVNLLRGMDADITALGEEMSQSGGMDAVQQEKITDLTLRLSKMIDQLGEKDKAIQALQAENAKLKGDTTE